MNLSTIAIKGIVAGFTLAAPGEAVGFLEIEETERNAFIGIITGFAAASADFLYGILAVLLWQLIGPFITGDQPILTLLGGIFLCIFGIRRLLDTRLLNKVKPIDGSIRKVFIATFLFTLMNASTILEFLSLFIGFDIEFSGYYELLVFVMGVFLGSLVWWICVSITDDIFKKRITTKILRCLNYISGIVIFSFGLYTLSESFFN
jgi:threonine/homoserine/homoserine lactone efflux protein